MRGEARIAAMILLNAAVATPVFACSCAFQGSPEEHVANTEYVFFGEAIEARVLSESEITDRAARLNDATDWQILDANVVAKLRAYKVVKGLEKEEVIEVYFQSTGTSCDYAPSVGAVQLYFVNNFYGVNFVGQCTQPALFYREDEREKYLKVFEEVSGESFDELRH